MKRKNEIQNCLKNESIAWAQLQVVFIALDSIISHHLQTEIPANIMGNF